MRTVRVIGLGLMGTNLGLKLSSQGIKVYGEDTSEVSLNRALSLGFEKTILMKLLISLFLQCQ